MPELPEVETVARLVRPHLVGRTVTGTRVGWLRTLGGLSRPAFARRVVGAEVARVGRRAKYIVVDLARDGAGAGALLVHLRMTGRLHVEDPDEPPGDYVRVALDLDDGRQLRFVDVRKFGRFTYSADPADDLDHLGPEPLGEEFTVDWLKRELRARRRMLKPLLLDQTFVAGLGNIYVDEALHRARLHPLQRADEVGPRKARALHEAIRETLARAIELEGSSFDTFYRTPEGQPGSYQHQFQVYARDGQPCRRCSRRIVKTVVGQRGTHLCPRCQPRPPSAPRSARSASG
ncbi:MAG: bifunctional DNA-formamidopyrimidine glycosylase/DNA-(apurinic or apyrimidinic site) lyase [Planctomycetota bacterium]